jgi:kumamolisin
MTWKKRVPLAGSEKPSMLHTESVAGKPDPNERIEVSVLLRRRDEGLESNEPSIEALGHQPVEKRRHLTHPEFKARHGVAPDDVAKLEQFAKEHNLTVERVHKGSRTVKLSGTLADIQRAFEAGELVHVEEEGKLFRARSGTLTVPAELSDAIIGVFGIDNRPAVKRRAEAAPHGLFSSKNVSFSVPDVASLYNFPTGLDGTGQCIAIIEINDVTNGKPTGGGFRTSDLDTYFQSIGVPTPKVIVISVDGGANLPGPAPGFDSEVALDIEVAGAVAPGATLAVYFAPNTTQGFIDCVNAALHDDVNKPSIVSISWGSPEDQPYSSPQLVNGLNEALQDAVQLGITVCVATGDNGSADQIPPDMDQKPHVDAPGCSPFALACGGTKLTVDGTTIKSEVVWNDGVRNWPGATGGGVSNLFARPTYQSSLTIPKSPTGTDGRGVPDVSAHAATSAGYKIFVNGDWASIGGTSAVAPLYAGLLARINQQLVTLGKPHAGFINPLLYQSPSAFRDITQGNNDMTGSLKVYNATTGWDPCTGLGSPDGTAIMKVLGG